MKKIAFKTLLSVICYSLILVACSNVEESPAPVRDAWYQPGKGRPKIHQVRQGESLYAIAWHYDLDYRDLAKFNHLKSPYALRVGQRIHLFPNSYKLKQLTTQSKQLASQSKHNTKKSIRSKNFQSSWNKKPRILSKHKYPTTIKYWSWPTQGKIVQSFSLANHSKGIDISGKRGQAIKAVAPGRVAYSGTGLHGYGNLIIVKHNHEFLSAYANNDRMLVKEGDWVQENQKIAEMGNSGAKHVMLHFELRKAGKPVNPMHYLGKQ